MARGAKRARVNVGPVEGPWELPTGWRWERLGSLVTKSSAKHQPDARSPLPFVGLEHIPPHQMRLSGVGRFADMRSAASAFRAGDVLYGRLRPYLNKVYLAEFAGACSGELLVLRPGADVLGSYLALTLHDARFLAFASHAVTGDRPRLDFGEMADFAVPVPPLDLQRRIVAQINDLFAEIDEGAEALAGIRSGADIYRRTLLHTAVTGQLTSDWRIDHTPRERGPELLQRAREVRRTAGLKDSRATGFDVASALPELPSGWCWATVRELTKLIRNGTAAKPMADPDGVPILRISSVRPLRVDATDVRRLPSGADIGGCMVNPGDLLVTRYNGSAALVGVCGRYRGATAVAHPDKLIRLVPAVTEDALADYLEIAMNVGRSRAYIEQHTKTTAGQHGVSGETVGNTPIPLPPRDEMQEVVSRVRSGLCWVSALLDTIENGNEVATLRQSILAAAFRGDLVA